VYNDFNIFVGTGHTIKKTKVDALVVGRKETGLEINAGRTKYRAMSGDQHAVQNYYTKIGNKSFARVGNVRCLRTTLMKQNSMNE
jgi:hypothetical protein